MKALFDLMAEKGRSALDDDSVYAEYNKLTPEAKSLADKMAESGRSVLDDDSVYGVYNKLSTPQSLTAPQAQVAPSASPSTLRKEYDEFADITLPRTTKNPTILNVIADYLTAPGRYVAGVGNVLGQVASDIYNGNPNSAEDQKQAFTSAMTNPEEVVAQQLQQAGVQKNIYKLPANIAAGIANDPMTVPSILYGGPVGTGIVKAGVRNVAMPALYSGLSDASRQLAEPDRELNLKEAGLASIVGGGLGLGSATLAKGLDIPAKSMLNNIDNLKKFAVTELKLAPEATEWLTTKMGTGEIAPPEVRAELTKAIRKFKKDNPDTLMPYMMQTLMQGAPVEQIIPPSVINRALLGGAGGAIGTGIGGGYGLAVGMGLGAYAPEIAGAINTGLTKSIKKYPRQSTTILKNIPQIPVLPKPIIPMIAGQGTYELLN